MSDTQSMNEARRDQQRRHPDLSLVFLAEFDERFYGRAHLDERKTANASREKLLERSLQHFMEVGLERRLPFREGLVFEEDFYAETYLKDADASQPYRHYVTVGVPSRNLPSRAAFVERRFDHCWKFSTGTVSLPLIDLVDGEQPFAARLEAAITVLGGPGGQVEIDAESAEFCLALAVFDIKKREYDAALLVLQKLLRAVPDYERARPFYRLLLQKRGVTLASLPLPAAA
ncbi:hypothetical protein [Jiella sonneratiae]|uniref:Tetratricopeptide repeat protein n=1 Tax=Jiella sonneratiae TaxID=2816856 RepID=A0ABS3J8N4_9HYPH|nr:hypothetical protein [Jiella sonneratiae]MBO0906034.1 hypothetical protein [Jiella sonneratiae]